MNSTYVRGHKLSNIYEVKKNEIIIGLSAYLHDSSVCFLKNGEIIYASQEERHTRIKNDRNFPFLAILNGIEYLGIKKSDISKIIFHESLNITKQNKKNILKKKILNDLSFIGLENFDLYFVDHHYSHAAAGYYSSDFENALIFTFDGMGEGISTSIFYGHQNSITNLKKIREPNSLGLLYSAFTYFLGFDVNSGEYKMMGLSPFGKKQYEDIIFSKLITQFEDGSFEVNKEYFNFYGNEIIINNQNFEELFSIKKRESHLEIKDVHCDIAASIQSVIEKIIFKIIAKELEKFNTKNIVLGGGVALNCIANGKIEKKFKKKINIFPSPGDSGNSFGSAIYASYSSPEFNDQKKMRIKNVFFGRDYSSEYKSVLSLIDKLNLRSKTFTSYDTIVDLLIDKKIIGFFSGRSEFGPRSLGNRSIIADPRSIDAQKTINLKVKFRESFRPFAPIIIENLASTYFDNCFESPFMQKTYYVKDSWLTKSNKNAGSSIFEKINQSRSQFPSITHVDNSARVQTISDQELPIYKLLEKFYKKTGCPMLINTSFNVNNEPIVETPFDAIKTFINTNIDYLVIDNLIISKNK